MAKKDTNKKEVSKKKPTAKKTVKAVEKKIEEPKKEVVEIEEPETKEEIKLNLEELRTVSEAKVDFVEQENELEVVNGDPAVLTNTDEVKEIQKEVIKEKKQAEIKNETPIKKITKKINQYFGYIWNGQAIDY